MSADQHSIVIEELDRHLRGEASPAFYQHLAGCEQCRAEVDDMSALSALFREFQTDSEPVEPPLGFYNRVSAHIVEQRTFSIWGLSSLSSVFFRRTAFASLLFLACLGGFLVSREVSEGEADAVSIMAQHDASGSHNESSDRDQLLVTLATYRQ